MSTSTVYRDGTWITSTDNKVRACFVDLGEGYFGEYDPNDVDDAPLYRLDIEVAADIQDTLAAFEETDDPAWVYPDDGSICTNVDITKVTAKEALDLLAHAAETLALAIDNRDSIKGTMDALSHLPIKRSLADLYDLAG